MKIYITSFIHDGKEYEGPNIHADSFDSASIMAEGQGLKVCSEGIETASQANYLIKNGSDEMQGYYFAKPVAIAHIPAAKDQAKEAFKALTLK